MQVTVKAVQHLLHGSTGDYFIFLQMRLDAVAVLTLFWLLEHHSRAHAASKFCIFC